MKKGLVPLKAFPPGPRIGFWRWRGWFCTAATDASGWQVMVQVGVKIYWPPTWGSAVGGRMGYNPPMVILYTYINIYNYIYIYTYYTCNIVLYGLIAQLSIHSRVLQFFRCPVFAICGIQDCSTLGDSFGSGSALIRLGSRSHGFAHACGIRSPAWCISNWMFGHSDSTCNFDQGRFSSFLWTLSPVVFQDILLQAARRATAAVPKRAFAGEASNASSCQSSAGTTGFPRGFRCTLEILEGSELCLDVSSCWNDAGLWPTLLLPKTCQDRSSISCIWSGGPFSSWAFHRWTRSWIWYSDPFLCGESAGSGTCLHVCHSIRPEDDFEYPNLRSRASHVQAVSTSWLWSGNIVNVHIFTDLAFCHCCTHCVHRSYHTIQHLCQDEFQRRIVDDVGIPPGVARSLWWWFTLGQEQLQHSGWCKLPRTLAEVQQEIVQDQFPGSLPGLGKSPTIFALSEFSRWWGNWACDASRLEACFAGCWWTGVHRRVPRQGLQPRCDRQWLLLVGIFAIRKALDFSSESDVWAFSKSLNFVRIKHISHIPHWCPTLMKTGDEKLGIPRH